MNRVLILISLAILSAGCYWDDEESYYPDSANCDTLDISYSADVLPILTNNCFACHSNVNAPDFTFGFALEDYDDVAAASSIIVGAINHDEGFIPMPKGREQLDSCQIGILEAWVNQGSLNN